MKSGCVSLRNSALRHPSRARPSGVAADLKETISITLIVRPRRDDKAGVIQSMLSQPLRERHYLSVGEFERTHGSAPEDLEMVARFALQNGLSVTERSSARCCVVVSGTLADVRKVFGIKFTRYAVGARTYRSYEGEINIPRELEGIVQAVLGLDDRALTVHHSFAPRLHFGKHTEVRSVARQYKFPKVTVGNGQSIAIIADGGGFYRRDIHAYWRQKKCPAPQVRVVNIGQASNDPAGVADIRKYWVELQKRLAPGGSLQTSITGDPQLDAHIVATIETTLDIELAGAFAPLHRIVVYFNDGSEQGLYQAFHSAITDKKNRPSVISYSWGQSEDQPTQPFVDAMEQVHQSAAIRGVTLCCSSGDTGDGTSACGGQPCVNYPASSPYVLGCGGTHLVISRNQEKVWNEPLNDISLASSGGVSALFTATPAWQQGAGVEKKTGQPGRGVPDVASKADLIFGYSMFVGNLDIGMGGTSAAAPLWASLIALINRKLGVPVGYLTPLLYSGLPLVTRQITRGNNGKYHASRGWNPCTGWGSPNGKALLAALARMAARVKTLP